MPITPKKDDICPYCEIGILEEREVFLEFNNKLCRDEVILVCDVCGYETFTRKEIEALKLFTN